MKYLLERTQFINESLKEVEALLTLKKCYQDNNGLWNCDTNLNLGTDVPRHIVLDDNGNLKVQFGIIKGDFTIPRNSKLFTHRRLKSLEGMPNEVHGNISLSFNDLTDLNGFPKHIGGNIRLNGNKLKSLVGLPTHIKGDLELEGNKLTNLEGFPKKVDGYINLAGNPIKNLEGLPKDYSGRLSIGETHISRLTDVPVNVKNLSVYNCRRLDTITDLIGSKVEYIQFIAPNRKTKTVEYEAEVYKPNQTKIDFYTNLVVYMLKEEIPVDVYTFWPEDFLNDELIRSVKGINKFNL